MYPTLEELKTQILEARLRLIRNLNAVAMALGGGALVVNQTYPDVVRATLGKLPPLVGAIALFAFGAVVHLAVRSAAKKVQP